MDVTGVMDGERGMGMKMIWDKHEDMDGGGG